MELLPIIGTGLVLIGVVVNRYSAMLIALVVVPAFYVGLDAGWWGCCGTGDFWQYGMVVVTAFGAALVALGIGIRRLFGR